MLFNVVNHIFAAMECNIICITLLQDLPWAWVTLYYHCKVVHGENLQTLSGGNGRGTFWFSPFSLVLEVTRLSFSAIISSSSFSTFFSCPIAAFLSSRAWVNWVSISRSSLTCVIYVTKWLLIIALCSLWKYAAGWHKIFFLSFEAGGLFS